MKCLLDRPGEIVRKEELLAAVWPNTTVAPNTLNVHIRRLRVRLGDASAPYRLLRSYSRIGFLLVATPIPRRIARPATEPTTRGDRSKFLRDVTIPDGTMLEPNQRFEKVWEIQNAGSVPWIGRVVRRVGACRGVGRITSDPDTSLSDTLPGQTCLIRVWLTAPAEAGSYVAGWKMYPDRTSGRACFPLIKPIVVSIDVLAPDD